jgi:hypothetical protein
VSGKVRAEKNESTKITMYEKIYCFKLKKITMFVYPIPLVVILTKNSKLEKFVHELNNLWKLSRSSLGAPWELVAVAGILDISLIRDYDLILYLVIVPKTRPYPGSLLRN